MASDDDLFDDMEAFLADGAEVVPAVGTYMSPEGEDHANRLLRARARAVRELARIGEVADAEKARIDAWRQDRAAGEEARIAHLDRLLEGWARAVNAADPRRKTLTLPNGTLSLRAPGYSAEVIDREALVEWLEKNRPDLLKIEPQPKAGDAKSEVLAHQKWLVAAAQGKAEGDPPAGLRLGPVAATDEDVAWYEVVTDDGVPVPGLRLARPTRDNFTVR